MDTDSIVHGKRQVGGKDVVLPLVLQDLVRRAEKEFEREGTFLKTYDGEDALLTAYENALDLCMYLKKKLMEQGS